MKHQDRIVRKPEARKRTGYSDTTLWRKIKAGEFPAPIKLSDSGRAVGWYESEIDAWLESRPRASTSEVGHG